MTWHVCDQYAYHFSHLYLILIISFACCSSTTPQEVGPGSLFLAGDPAQSVVEGTGFRFEEVRSVGHYVAGDRRHLIPEKPKVVNINFRSHSGILNCAGRFLDLLFDYFPGSAKQLKKDYGLFRGARPGVFHKVEVQQLSTLLQGSLQGCVILTHDESASRWREALNHPLVCK